MPTGILTNSIYLQGQRLSPYLCRDIQNNASLHDNEELYKGFEKVQIVE